MTRSSSDTGPGVTRVLLVLSLATTAGSFTGRTWASANEARMENRTTGAPVSIEIAFMLDPRLTRGLYLGDRWVSPPIYSANLPWMSAVVEARAHGVDAAGKRIAILPSWVPADPGMVTLTPREGSEVRITVLRAGETRLRVTSEGISRDLAIRAVRKDDAIQVEIAQVSPAGTAAANERTQVLGGQKEKVSYALGVDLGRKLKKQLAEIDAGLLSRGITDALAGGNTLLAEAELRTILLALQNETRTKRIKEQKDLAERNKIAGETFLAENRTKDDVVTLASGLQYRVLKAGGGAMPGPTDTVVCHYRGTTIDGREFDSSRRRDKPATFSLERVIRGWREALPLMRVGSKWELFVPSSLAYGERGARGKVGPSQALVFEVELLSVRAEAEATPRPASSPPGEAGVESATP